MPTTDPFLPHIPRDDGPAGARGSDQTSPGISDPGLDPTDAAAGAGDTGEHDGPDVLPPDPAAAPADSTDGSAPTGAENPVFRTPTPGARLSPEELEAELGSDDPA